MAEPASIKEQVRNAYSEVALHPEGRHAFPCGEEFAVSLGFPETVLRRIPKSVRESFAGVSNVSLSAELGSGEAILDLGCGAGLDSFIAASRVGDRGRVIGIDFSDAMLDRARDGARTLNVSNVSFIRANAEEIPSAASSFDSAIVNGIFNLNVQREEILRELARVLRPGGRVFASELILRENLPEDERANASNWFA